ncbi:hypothetical protein NKJ87_20075 [Mesorhizobium sp. M0027]|uniref:hypothetical protein n=1 Tax=Mesorhizobium sp. M0027 TaxID=2956848 RepID=UPI00333BBB77
MAHSEREGCSKKQRTDDLSSWTRFVDTGEIFDGNEQATAAHVSELQLKNGGCYALEMIDPGRPRDA